MSVAVALTFALGVLGGTGWTAGRLVESEAGITFVDTALDAVVGDYFLMIAVANTLVRPWVFG